MKFIENVSRWFLGFCILFIPFPFYIFSSQREISNALFVKPSSWIVKTILDWKVINPEITSDSATMYGLVILLLVFAILASIAFHYFSFLKKYQTKFFQVLRLLFFYYLSMQLLKYGFDKIFKAQFYLPEPNILYTTLGNIDKDLLFWSTMGTSRAYNIFMGMLEVVPAIFLLFRKARPLGLLIAIPVLINVVAINFCFDISVKIYSVFLLLLSCYLFATYVNSFYQFFILQKKAKLNNSSSLFKEKGLFQTALKILIIGLIFFEVLFPYFSTQNFNDDFAPRPFLHGAYEVEEIVTQDSVNNEQPRVKRLYIHRNGYLIFQNEKEEMQDFKLTIDEKLGKFELTNYKNQSIKLDYQYFPSAEILEVQFFQNKKEYTLKTKVLDWKKLPALQNNFHWNIDGL